VGTTADQIRTAQRQLWDTFSTGWEKWDGFVQAINRPAGDAIVESLDISPDQRHLEVAAGTGEPGLRIASMAPQGKVVLTDISSRMLAAAVRFAADQGLKNVEARECSADDLPFEDASFDSVSCRFGFMFFPDLAQTAAGFERVLRPGGRAAAVVWAGPESNLWATLPTGAISSEVEMPAPDPEGPGMFRCSTPGFMTELFEGAGFSDVRERDVPIELVADSAEQYWSMVTELTGPVVAILSSVDDATRARINDKVLGAAREHEGDGKLRLGGMARCVVGTKP
jgi:SAM-dependent methyltransferase